MSKMERFTTIWEARRWASLFLKQHNREEGVADLLLMHHLDMSRANLLASSKDTFPVEIQELLMEQVRAHAEQGIPVQHLIGHEEFYGRHFTVNEHVLIPRPETEELVQLVLREIDREYSGKQLTVLDLGAGSGAISITLKKENPMLCVKAVDISEDALAVAKHNAVKLDADVEFFQGNFLEPFIEKGIKADIVVSNPPYISINDKDTLDDTVKNYDPDQALYAGDDGLDAYRIILQQLPSVVKNKSLLAFEIGYQQGEAVQKIIQSGFPQSNPQIVQDINGKDRMVYSWLQ
ncbi:release factor glutamine methyltransferase [Salirhabdus euzebyi]|uniref:Release factor glutamine methyltransferase n=2 Tax=Salirhabdus euzebyi TaxID=394506 RepID=A0A841Q6F4_9BACI|nr:release factor glutamine methyltransferase [Salirhabdus euzebyi]